MKISNKKIILLLSLAAIVFVLALVFIYIFAFTGKGFADITVYPKDSSFTINQKTYSGDKLIELEKGEYKITFSRKYFKTETVSLKIKRNRTTVMTAELEVDTKNNKASNLPIIDQELLQAAGDRLFDQQSSQAVENNKIITKLPYITDSFRVDYTFDSKKPSEAIYELTLYKKASQQSETQLKKAVASWFKENGYDLDKLNYKWIIE